MDTEDTSAELELTKARQAVAVIKRRIEEADELRRTIGMAAASEIAPTSSLIEPFVGQNVIVRTVTMTLTGRITGSDGQFLALEDAAWIADSGRWAEAVRSGSFSEVEPFQDGTILVGIGAVIDLAVLPFDLPRSQK